MAKPNKKPQKSGGRVTPKGTQNPAQGAKKLTGAAGAAAGSAKGAAGSLSDQVAEGMKDVAAKVGDGKDMADGAADSAAGKMAGAAVDGAGKVDGVKVDGVKAAGGKAAGAAAATTAGAAKVATKKPTKRKVSGGRVTPKGTQNYTKKAPAAASHTNYQDLAPSPTWVPVLMFGLLILGALVIMVNYMGYLPPYNDVATVTNPDTGFGSGTSNWYLLLGLGLILGGIITATRFR